MPDRGHGCESEREYGQAAKLIEQVVEMGRNRQRDDEQGDREAKNGIAEALEPRDTLAAILELRQVA
jgi:hypothetical protein